MQINIFPNFVPCSYFKKVSGALVRTKNMHALAVIHGFILMLHRFDGSLLHQNRETLTKRPFDSSSYMPLLLSDQVLRILICNFLLRLLQFAQSMRFVLSNLNLIGIACFLFLLIYGSVNSWFLIIELTLLQRIALSYF